MTLIYSTNKQFIYNDDKMANIFEFKYEFYDGYSNKPNKYIILQTNKKETSMLTYNYGKKQCINITDKVDKFCNDISKSEFLGWHNKNFQSNIDFFPSTHWLLRIKTDSSIIYCKGRNMFPNNWNEFIEILNNIGIII